MVLSDNTAHARYVLILRNLYVIKTSATKRNSMVSDAISVAR